jgi:uncharacterized protein YprB with RNaseH-like and TPR domain
MTDDVVSVDIETTGLSFDNDITCVAVVASTWKKVWILDNKLKIPSIKSEILDTLNDASLIYSFNGATFDIPFLQTFFQYENDIVGSWMMKLVDPLYAARALLGFQACAKLDDILILNGIQCKTSSGGEAVKMAYEGRWSELADYCEADARLTFELMQREKILWKHDFQFVASLPNLWIRSHN